MLKKVEENLDENGRGALAKWFSLFAPLDAALIRGNMKRAAHVLKESIPVIRNVVPHIHDKKIRDHVSRIADITESLMESGFDLRKLDGAFQNASGGLRNILQIVVDKVVKPLLGGVRNLLSGLELTS